MAVLVTVLATMGAGTLPASAGPPPAGFEAIFTKYPLTVNGTYTPLMGAALDCATDGFGILWYAPGSAPDFLWGDVDNPGGSIVHSNRALTISGTYEPFVGDFDGDGCDDIFWYAPGSAGDFVWYANADGSFTSKAVSVSGSYTPVVSDYNATGPADIFWYADGGGTESIWLGTGSRTFTKTTGPQVATSGYQVGALDGDLLYFYKPGAGADYLWAGVVAGQPQPDFSVRLQPISATYEAHPMGNLLLLYGPGSAPDKIIGNFGESGSFDQVAGTIGGPFRLVATGQSGQSVILLHAPGSTPDALWVQSAG